jgi:hypothetical protein
VPLAWADLAIEPGATLSFVRVPYATTDTDAPGESFLWSALATVRLARQLGRHFEVGAGGAAGIALWTGLGEKNPFTVAGAPPSHVPVLPTVGVGFDARVLLGDGRVFLAISPSVWAASTTGIALARAISHVTRTDLLAGVGFTF